jgi:hypothetical protein
VPAFGPISIVTCDNLAILFNQKMYFDMTLFAAPVLYNYNIFQLVPNGTVTIINNGIYPQTVTGVTNLDCDGYFWLLYSKLSRDTNTLIRTLVRASYNVSTKNLIFLAEFDIATRETVGSQYGSIVQLCESEFLIFAHNSKIGTPGVWYVKIENYVALSREVVLYVDSSIDTIPAYDNFDISAAIKTECGILIVPHSRIINTNIVITISNSQIEKLRNQYSEMYSLILETTSTTFNITNTNPINGDPYQGILSLTENYGNVFGLEIMSSKDKIVNPVVGTLSFPY